MRQESDFTFSLMTCSTTATGSTAPASSNKTKKKKTDSLQAETDVVEEQAEIFADLYDRDADKLSDQLRILKVVLPENCLTFKERAKFVLKTRR